jgi:serine/threonine protein kinase
MPDQSPNEFTQTVVGTVTSKSSLSTPSAHAALEGRFPPGTLLNGRYRIIALLGKGGMGEVYRATDMTLGQSVALKFLHALSSSDPRFLERFHSEVRIARQVSHPNVCRVYDIGEAEGLPFISMEYVDGEDLASLLRRIGRLPSDKAIEISRKACAGLAAAHAKGVIHRDLKPHNIMLDRHGEVLICDFGLAAVASELNAAEIRQGTPAYMAPEQIKGTEVTHSSDIYSLGLVLYELFTGKRAYSAPNINEMLNLQEAMSLTSMSSHANDIDPAVENIIRRCLDPMPGNRPMSALGVAAALPGGDPLAAALAAGQTPSPELVAASQSAGLAKSYSIPLLGFVLIFLLAFPYLKGHVETLSYVPIEMPQAALMVKARETAAAFGYPAKPADWYDGFEHREGLERWLEERKDRDWRKLFSQESPLSYVYRQSPKPLAEDTDGSVNWSRPALETPNMVRLYLDSSGRLRLFEAVPPRQEDAAVQNFDENRLFAAIGFDRSKFSAAEFYRTPLTPFDQRVALKGAHPELAGAEVTVQYATFKGRLTSLYFKQAWTPPISDAPKPWSTGQVIQACVTVGSLLTFLFFSASLARKNWLANRADRQGALRLCLIHIAANFVAWMLGAHYVPDARMLNFATYALADALLQGYILWQLYLALEPTLRSRWPQAIITWNRALAGRVWDTQVGAHILMGVAMGIIITIGFLSKDWFNFERAGLLSGATIRNASARSWLAVHILSADKAILVGFLIFFVLLGLKVLLRREIPAMIAAALLLCATNGDLYTTSNLSFDLPLYFLVSLAITVGLVRFGLLTTLVAVFTTNTLGNQSVATDLNAWFMPYALATLLLLSGIAVFAFWRSLGDQSIVGDGVH